MLAWLAITLGLATALSLTLPLVGEAQNSNLCAGKRPTVDGTESSDRLIGTKGADVIAGGAGADRVLGRGGADIICGGPGADLIDGGAGSDQLIGGLANDRLSGGTGTDHLDGGRGNDKATGGLGDIDLVLGGAGDDSVSGGAGNGDLVRGGPGADEVDGGPGNRDIVEGNGSTDLIDGGPGGEDIVSYARASAGSLSARSGGVNVTLDHISRPLATNPDASADGADGIDQISGVEDVIGSVGSDQIYGDPNHVNRLEGGPGEDLIIGAGPGDTAFAGSGIDYCPSVSVRDACEFDEVPPFVEPPPADPGFGSLVEVDSGIAGPSISVVGTSLDSRITVSQTASTYTVTDSAGVIFRGPGCTAASNTEVSCSVSAKISLGQLPVLLGSGNDSLQVLGDASVIANGGAGTNFLVGGDRADVLSETGRTGTLDGGGGSDTLMAGGELGYHLLGGTGDDLLVAGSPCFTGILDGGPGLDNASFAKAPYGVRARLGGSVHSIFSSQVCFPIRIRNSESLEGSNFEDVLVGDAGDNHLFGRGGADTFFSLGGDDSINARDGHRDRRINCGPGSGDRSGADANDPPPRSC